jgi:hypothetical protein
MIRKQPSILILLLTVLALAGVAPATADPTPSRGLSLRNRRVALVIGNAAYKNAPPLANTIADATVLAQLFRNAGFDTVISRTDLGVVDFKRTVREFLRTAEGADIAVV